MQTIAWLRHFRITGYAVFDLAAAFLGIFLLSPLLSRLSRKLGLEIPGLNWLYLTLPLGIAAHLVVGRITPMTRDLLDLEGHYILKAVMAGLVFLGARNIKRVDKGE